MNKFVDKKTNRPVNSIMLIFVLLFPLMVGAQKIKYFESVWHDTTLL